MMTVKMIGLSVEHDNLSEYEILMECKGKRKLIKGTYQRISKERSLIHGYIKAVTLLTAGCNVQFVGAYPLDINDNASSNYDLSLKLVDLLNDKDCVWIDSPDLGNSRKIKEYIELYSHSF